ncbi:uncharacterized protein LOC133799543 [Humulus lupulus]|uniref:uncharacterized protein LOC133799543 n=1 Tax=Humulus lupulus TaxID=3486 RepID=UPI002B401890|nr:uncharacterized protein LOC133799543 [Humulus lupulus]
MGDYEKVSLTKDSSAILQRKLPKKLRDPRRFTIPCTIGNIDCKQALCDMGASINLMPLSIFTRRGIGEARPTTVQLADYFVKHPRGVIEVMLVKVDKFIFHAHFIVLDIQDANVSIILGRPFLATGQTLIDVQK